MKRRILPLLTTLALCLTLCPAPVLAEGEQPAEPIQTVTGGETSEETPSETPEDTETAENTSGGGITEENSETPGESGENPDVPEGDQEKPEDPETKLEQPEDTEKQPETPDDVEENPTELVDEKLCPHHKEHTEECGDSCECRCTLCEAIAAIQAQIDALPEPEEATADEALTEQLNAISQSLAELSRADAALVDISRLEALAELFSVPEETVKVYRNENDVASVTVEGVTQYFESVRAAFKAANEEGKAVVTLLKDTEIEDDTGESGEYTAIAITSDVTLDAGDHTLTGKSGKAFHCSSPTVFIVRDGGTFTLQRGTIHATAGYKVISVRGGTFNMEGGIIESDASGFVLSVVDDTTDAYDNQKTESSARLSGGTINTPDKAVHIHGKGSSAVFDGCTLTVHSMSLNMGATLDISDGTITSKGSNALTVATSDGANTKLNVSGGTIITDTDKDSRCLSVQGWNSSVRLSGGTFIKKGSENPRNSTIECDTVGNSIKLNDLLVDGYSYNQNGVWLSEDEVNSLDKLVGTVIVGKMAFTFTEQPVSDTAITYGVDKNLQVSVERAGDVEDEITYQWFYRPKAEEGADEEDFQTIEGATSATVSLKEIPVGEYEFYCEVSCGEFVAASRTAAVSVSKVQPYITDLSAASIVYGDALISSELTGTAQYSETDATAIPGTFAWKESTVQPSVSDSNTTEYTVVFTPEDAVNYESVEKTVKLAVGKKPLTVTGITAAGKRYDGNNQVQIAAVVLDGKVGTDEVSVNITGLTGTVSGANVGNYTAVTLPQMTRTGAAAENYTLTQPTGAVETSVTISKVALLTPKTGDLSVVNKHTHTYTFGLGALRPDVPEGMSLGSSAVTYTLGPISLGDYYTGGAEIDGQTLTLPIQAVESEEIKEIGTVTVIIHTDNFEDMTAVIRVRSVNKILPAGGPEPSSDTLTYGKALKEITLCGTMLDTENNIEVPGIFTWSSPENRPAVQEHYSAAWTFTPDDNDTYAIVTGTVIIQVEPAPVESAVITLEPAAFRYDGTAHSPTITGVKLGETLLEEGVDYTADIPTGTEAGSYTVTITGKGNYTGTATATFKINPVKAENITLPNDTEARLTVESGLTSVPDGLQGTTFNTVSAIETKLRTEVTSAMNDPNVQVAVYDVRLQYLENGVWKDVDPDNFPVGGVTAVLPYPNGTNGTNYTFTVQHMISHTHGDKQAGEVENLPYTPVSDGLQCMFTSLSPVAVGYKLKEKTPSGGNTSVETFRPSGGSFYESTDDTPADDRDEEAEFWQTVREQIKKAKSGDTVKVNARGYDRMPATVMTALKRSDNITLRIRWSGGEEIVIPSAKALSEPLRIYYPLSYLAKYDFGDLVPEPTPEHLNPATGGDIEVEAPVTAEAPLDAAGAPVVTDPRRGLAETEEQAEQGMEKAIPGVYQPEIPASEAVNPAEPITPEPETGRSGGMLPLVLALLAAAVCGGVWVWKNKRDWFAALRKSK